MNGSASLSLLWFVAIIALIPLALWLLKRTPLGGSNAAGVMRTVAALPLSPSQRIVTIEVGAGEDRRWLVLGVTSQTITTLHTMTPQIDDVPPGGPPTTVPAFATLLGNLRGKRDDRTPPGSTGGR
jgi:flagellar protein FliO/FliZ